MRPPYWCVFPKPLTQRAVNDVLPDFSYMKTIKDYLFLFMAWLVIVMLCSPVLLIFTEGQDGAPTVWNLVGIGWLALLFLACKKFFKD